jgi:AcrR family transcriptional regulator
VLLAAIELVNTEGVNGLSLRAAAERVGVTHPAVYRYFPDKASLLAAVAEEGFRALRAAIVREWGDLTDPADRFRQLVIAYVRFALDHPTHFRIMFGREAADKGAYPTLRAAEVGAFSLLVDAIIEAQRNKQVRAGDPREIALSGWVMVHGFASLVLDGLVEWVGLSSTEVQHLATVLTRSLFLGVGSPAPTATGTPAPPSVE